MKLPFRKDSADPGSARSSVSPRVRAIILGAAAVVALAAVILVITALSDPRGGGPAPQQTGISSADQSRLEYREALDALGSGDTSKAVELLEKAIDHDPDNSEAQRTLDEVTSPDDSDNTQPEDGDNDPKDPGDDEQPTETDPAFLKATDDLAALLPDYVDGFALGSVTGTESDVTRSGRPNTPSAASQSLWTVHDRESESAANAFVSTVSTSLYDQDVKSLTIDGAKARFGTDGKRFASIVYVRGRYVFEVVLTSLGGSPQTLEEDAEQAAGSFPDEMP